MKKGIAGFAIVLLLTLIPMWSLADVSVTLRLDRSEATLADTIRMTVKISGTRSSDSRPVLYGLEHFNVRQGGTSSRVEIINGKVTAGFDYTYFIQPKKVGNFRIGPAEIKMEDKALKSNIATLAVKSPSQRSGLDRGPLFIKAEVSSHDVFIEEQCIYILKLYRRTRVSDLSLNLPEVEHVVFRQLGGPLEYRSTHGGLDYQVLEIRYALLPSREGDYIIGPSRMNMAVLETDNRSPFDRFFRDPFSSGRPVALVTEPLKLKVHPLPEQGKPADFTGLVGDFHMETTLDPASIEAGESATLTVKVSGRGNANRIPDLKIPEINHIKIYADQPVLSIQQDKKGLTGTKVMKWALVPEKTGQIEIPALSLSFFDAEKKAYRVLNTPSRILSVMPGKKQAVTASMAGPENRGTEEGPSKQEIKELGKDILPIYTSMKVLSVTYRSAMTGWLFWLALLAPFSVYMISFFTLKLIKRSSELPAQSRPKKALRELMKQCRQDGLSCNHLMDAVKTYLNNRFNLSIGVLTADEAVRVLRAQGVGTETAERMGSLIRELEDAVYTGKGQEPADPGQDVSKLVKAIEKETP